MTGAVLLKCVAAIADAAAAGTAAVAQTRLPNGPWLHSSRGGRVQTLGVIYWKLKIVQALPINDHYRPYYGPLQPINSY